MMKRLMAALSLAILGGCVSFAPLPSSPPQQDRLQGLANPGQIQLSQSRIIGSSKFKLAIVNSVNVQPQIQSYHQFSGQFDRIIKAYVSEEQKVKADAAAILSDKVFLDSIDRQLSSRFAETIRADDLREAFNKGADYVAVVDVRFEVADLTPEIGFFEMPSDLLTKHVADISVLLINRSLEGGPDIQIKNTYVAKGPGKGPEANIREMLSAIKDTRLNSLRRLDAELEKVIIK